MAGINASVCVSILSRKVVKFENSNGNLAIQGEYFGTHINMCIHTYLCNLNINYVYI